MSARHSFETLITVEELALRIDGCVVVDCRHALTDASAGRTAYREAHIPGAVFLHQDEDLAGPHGPGLGRHPLPDRGRLLARLREAGLHEGQQLVAYDADSGMMAARLWWLARWLGHRQVAVLDGGLAAWRKAGYPVSRDEPTPAPGDLAEHASVAPAVDAHRLLDNLPRAELLVVDARAGERYRGEVEPLDPVAGHIPGAINRPQTQNLRPDMTFKPAPVLRAEFEALLGDRPAASIVHSCGSGISACHNLLAMEYAGLAGSALYPGSWSEWVADRSRPVATGPLPG
ncbi:MAG: sulfurtransferase [Burkholderiaceae bacterium]